MELLSEGAEAKIYTMVLCGAALVAKVREPKDYREKSLDVMLRESRTRKEARAMHYARAAGLNVPAIVALGRFSIYMEHVEGRLLKDAKGVDAATFAKIGGVLALMHRGNITHGDFTPANIMLSGDKIFVIDFGLAEMSGGVEEKALDLLLMKRAIGGAEYRALEKGYLSHGGGNEVLARLADIILRGRYQTRTLA